jgi:hypothetical protein
MPNLETLASRNFSFPSEAQDKFEEIAISLPETSISPHDESVVFINPESGFIIKKAHGIVARTFYGFKEREGVFDFFRIAKARIGILSPMIPNFPNFPDEICLFLKPGPLNSQRAAPHTYFLYTWPPNPETNGAAEFHYYDGDRTVWSQFDEEGQPSFVQFHNKNPDAWWNDQISTRPYTPRAQSIQNKNRGHKLRVNDNYYSYLFMTGGVFTTRVILPRIINPREIFNNLISPELVSDPLQQNNDLDNWRKANLLATVGIKVEDTNIPYNPTGYIDLSRLSELIQQQELEDEVWEEK